MITSLSGTLTHISSQRVVISVGGVGFEVFITTSAYNRLPSLGQVAELPTYLVVREDALTLYGFAAEEEKAIFELLISVSGVGPRLAISVLNTLTPEMLANAIQRDEPEIISRVPGIGKKTAQKIVFELKGRLLPDTMPEGLGAVSPLDTEVIEALISMGFSIVESQAALQAIPREAPEDIEERIRLALSFFDS
nr:Holliday junction branch migration protein RuvA [Anaerolineae bacterium]